MALRKIDMIPTVILQRLLECSYMVPDSEWDWSLGTSRSGMVALHSSSSWSQKLGVLEADVFSWKQQLGSLKSCLA